MNTSDNHRTASVSPWVSSINLWVSSLKSSGFDTSSLASATDPLVEQALTDTLVQAQGIVEEDFSDSPSDLMREKAFQDYLAYCRDQRIFDTIEGALGIESAEESEDTQGISANETASSQQVQALLANFSPSDENADDNLPQDVGYSSDYADLDWEDADAYEDLSVAEDDEDGDSPDEDAVDWDDEEDSDEDVDDDSDTAGYSSDEDAVDWGDDEDSEDSPGYSSDEDNLDWGDDEDSEDSPGYSSDEDNLDWDDDEDSEDSPGYSSDEDNLDWDDDDRPAPRPAPPASLKTASSGPLGPAQGRNGPAPTPGTYTPQNGSQDAVGRTADMLTSAYDFISASLRSKKG